MIVGPVSNWSARTEHRSYNFGFQKRSIEMFQKLTRTAIVVLIIFTVGTIHAADWGTLKGQIIYDGTPPKPKKINVTKDIPTCTKHHPLDERLLVDSKTKGIKDVAIFIRVKRGQKLAVHSDYDKTAKDKVILDNRHCRFEPRICLVRTSQTLVVTNSDPVGHNTNAGGLFNNPAFNVVVSADGNEFKLKKAERRAAPVSCSIHPWMQAYLVVRDDPYMTVSAKDGKFEIKNIPAGEHEFAFWQQAAGHLRYAKFTGGKTTRRGRVKIKIDGVVDVGKVVVDPKIFKL